MNQSNLESKISLCPFLTNIVFHFHYIDSFLLMFNAFHNYINNFLQYLKPIHHQIKVNIKVEVSNSINLFGLIIKIIPNSTLQYINPKQQVLYFSISTN